MKKQGIVKIGALQRIGGLLVPPADDLRLYASHPNPAADYAEAVRRVESKIATEVDFDPGSHTILLTHGAKTAKAIIFVHGTPGAPLPSRRSPRNSTTEATTSSS